MAITIDFLQSQIRAAKQHELRELRVTVAIEQALKGLTAFQNSSLGKKVAELEADLSNDQECFAGKLKAIMHFIGNLAAENIQQDTLDAGLSQTNITLSHWQSIGAALLSKDNVSTAGREAIHIGLNVLGRTKECLENIAELHTVVDENTNRNRM